MDLALLVGSFGKTGPCVQELLDAEAALLLNGAVDDDVAESGGAGAEGVIAGAAGDEGQDGVLCGAQLWAGDCGCAAPDQRPDEGSGVGLLGLVTDEPHAH